MNIKEKINRLSSKAKEAAVKKLFCLLFGHIDRVTYSLTGDEVVLHSVCRNCGRVKKEVRCFFKKKEQKHE